MGDVVDLVFGRFLRPRYPLYLLLVPKCRHSQKDAASIANAGISIGIHVRFLNKSAFVFNNFS